MHFKYRFIILVLCFTHIQVYSEEFKVSETNPSIENFEYSIKKLITNLNSSYENLQPEEKFAAHIIKMTTKEVLNHLTTNILNGFHNLEEITNNTINFTICTNKYNTEFDKGMEIYSNCINNKTENTNDTVENNFIEAITLSDTKLSETIEQFDACNSKSDKTKCNEELAESMKKSYDEISKKVNDVNLIILSNYRMVVKEMPFCTTDAIQNVIDIEDLLKCLVLLMKNP